MKTLYFLSIHIKFLNLQRSSVESLWAYETGGFYI